MESPLTHDAFSMVNMKQTADITAEWACDIRKADKGDCWWKTEAAVMDLRASKENNKVLVDRDLSLSRRMWERADFIEVPIDYFCINLFPVFQQGCSKSRRFTVHV